MGGFQNSRTIAGVLHYSWAIVATEAVTAKSFGGVFFFFLFFSFPVLTLRRFTLQIPFPSTEAFAWRECGIAGVFEPGAKLLDRPYRGMCVCSSIKVWRMRKWRAWFLGGWVSSGLIFAGSLICVLPCIVQFLSKSRMIGGGGRVWPRAWLGRAKCFNRSRLRRRRRRMW